MPTKLEFAGTLPSAILDNGIHSLLQNCRASWLSDQVSFPTIKLYLAKIRFAHIENSLTDPFADAPLLYLLLRGIKRTNVLSSRRRLPITMSVMRQLKGALADDPQFASQDKLMLWSAFTLAFFGFLRSSEFTSPSLSYFNSLVHLSCSDISFTSHGSLILQLKLSKTDPFRKGCSITLAPSGRSVRAVRAMLRYLDHQPPRSAPPPPVFLHLNLAPPAPTLRLHHRVLCFPQFPHWSCNYRCRGWPTLLAYPNPWPMVQQLLHPIYQDTCFNTPNGPCQASHHP